MKNDNNILLIKKNRIFTREFKKIMNDGSSKANTIRSGRFSVGDRT